MPDSYPLRLLKLALFPLLLCALASCDIMHTGFDDYENARSYSASNLTAAPDEVDTLLVMTWNIKYGGGRLKFFWECNGDRYLMTKGEVLSNMAPIAAKISEVDPDIILLQEVDVCSKRSAYVDQMQYLLDNTDLNYGTYASQWKADYVPSDGIGRIDSGNAILSRWPIREATRIALPLIGDQPSHERYFYLKRNILRARIDLPGVENLYAVNVHTAAFAEDDTKKKHIDRFREELDLIDASSGLFIAGGDLNEIPPGSPVRSGFPDDQCTDSRFKGDDYTGEDDWLDGLYNAYSSAIPILEFQADPDDYFSYTGDGNGFWNRKLDYLFTNGNFITGSGMVHQDERTGSATMPLSDHAPVVARLELP